MKKLLIDEYRIVLAADEKDFQAVKEIRKKVFAPKYKMAVEMLEKKGYLFGPDDRQSFLYLLQHKATGQYVGSTRLFFVNPHTPGQLMPMQKDGNVKHIGQFTVTLPILEISRGSLVHDLPSHQNLSGLLLRTSLTIGLMLATRINFILYPSSMIFTIIEPSLHRILKRQNVNFEKIGEAVEYYGMRTPFAIERKQLLRETEENMGDLTRHYLRELCADPEPFWRFIDQNPYLERSDMRLERVCQLFKEYGDGVDLSLLIEG